MHVRILRNRRYANDTYVFCDKLKSVKTIFILITQYICIHKESLYKIVVLTGFENNQSSFLRSSPVIQIHFTNGVSDITFLEQLSTQDK